MVAGWTSRVLCVGIGFTPNPPPQKKNEQNKNPSGKLLLNHCLWNIQSLIFLERISTLPFFEGNKTRVLEVSTRLFTKKKAKGHIAVLNDSTKARGKIFMTLRAKYMIPSLRRNPKKKFGQPGGLLERGWIYRAPGFSGACGFLLLLPGIIRWFFGRDPNLPTFICV